MTNQPAEQPITFVGTEAGTRAGLPFETACRPFGAVSAIENDALSLGWSLDGSQA